MTRRHLPGAGVAAVAGVVATLAGCTGPDDRAAPAPSSPTTAQATVSTQPSVPEPAAEPPPPPPEPAEPVVVPLSPSEYQEELSARRTRIQRALERVSQARRYTALAKRVASAEIAVATVAERLGNLVSPVEVAGSHETLVKGLRRLAAGLAKTGRAVDERDLCAASSVRARLGRLPARKPLRQATNELEVAGYDVAGLVPEAAPTQTRRLATGDFVFVEARSGLGTLTVENGLGVDGVVVLTQRKTPVTSMYVRRNDVGVIGGIPDGTYRAYFTLGMDWDGDLRRFTRKCSFARFDDPMTFESVSSGFSIQYQTYSITLHPVVGGTAETSGVDPDAFPG